MANQKGNTLGAGRKVGSINKSTADVKALAGQHTAAAIEKLAEIAKTDNHVGQVAALKELLDRAVGKPSQAIEQKITGELKITWVNDWRDKHKGEK